MSKDDNLKEVGKQTRQQVRDQKKKDGSNPRPNKAKAPDPFRHQSERERKQPEINHSQQGTDKAPESGTER